MTIKKLIVSNYNWDIEWLKITYDYGFSPDNTVIYNKKDTTKVVYDINHKDTLVYENITNQKNVDHLGEVIFVPNVGSGIYDIFEFIIKNYGNLPDISIFIKGNIFNNKDVENYYTTKTRFIESLTSDKFFSIWQDKFLINGDYRHVGVTLKETLEEGRLVQYIPHIYDSRMEYRYFSKLQDILNWCFVNPPVLEYVEFIPSCNFVVPKKNILKYSKKLYKRLQSIISYCPNFYAPWSKNVCGEAYILERLFYFIWNENLKEREVIENIIAN